MDPTDTSLDDADGAGGVEGVVASGVTSRRLADLRRWNYGGVSDGLCRCSS